MFISALRSEQQQDSDIQCIFFSEFHHTAGPRITYQVPDDCVTKDVFDSLSVYIIPKTELQGKLMAVNALGYKIIGCPIGIDNRKYPRNRFIFNLCFVCDASKRTVQYEPLVRKLANYLVTLELESDFLSSDETKATLPGVMTQIRNELNKYRRCSIPINESNTIHLKVVSVQPQPPKDVLDHYVPVFTNTKGVILPSQWDLTTQQILPYIDGFRHIKRIAAEADVEVSLVKACVQNMMYYGVITLIPIFQYSNVYMPTPEISLLASNSHLQSECLRFVAKQGRPPPTFRSVFLLYCGLSPGITVRDLCTRHNPHLLGVDERKLIQFGLIKGLIRRLHKYPVQLNLNTEPASAPRHNATQISKYFDGCHSFDEICCKTGLSYQELDEKVEQDSSVVICWK